MSKMLNSASELPILVSAIAGTGGCIVQMRLGITVASGYSSSGSLDTGFGVAEKDRHGSAEFGS